MCLRSDCRQKIVSVHAPSWASISAMFDPQFIGLLARLVARLADEGTPMTDVLDRLAIMFSSGGIQNSLITLSCSIKEFLQTIGYALTITTSYSRNLSSDTADEILHTLMAMEEIFVSLWVCMTTPDFFAWRPRYPVWIVRNRVRISRTLRDFWVAIEYIHGYVLVDVL